VEKLGFSSWLPFGEAAAERHGTEGEATRQFVCGACFFQQPVRYVLLVSSSNRTRREVETDRGSPTAPPY